MYSGSAKGSTPIAAGEDVHGGHQPGDGGEAGHADAELLQVGDVDDAERAVLAERYGGGSEGSITGEVGEARCDKHDEAHERGVDPWTV